MSRRIAIATAVCAVLAGTAASAGEQTQGRLTVVGAGGALQEAERKAFFEPFARAEGVNLVEDSYSGQMAKVKAMVAAGDVTWDVVQVEQNSMLSGCEEGLFERFHWKLVEDRRDFLPSAQSECGVGAFVWSMVPTYDTDRIADGPKSWADFWDLQRWPGKRGFRQTAKMTLEIALLADGVRPTDIYAVLGTKQGQDRAFAKLDQIKSSIVWWTSGAESLERVAAGDVAMSATFNGRVSAANASRRRFAEVWPGQVYGTDFWGIVKGSPHRKAAEDFIAFASRPGPQGEFARIIDYGFTNLAAAAAVDAKVAGELPTTPANMDGAVALDTAFWADNGDALEARFATWKAQ